MLRGQPLVPEIAVDLVHALEAADDEPLEVQLGRDAQVHVLAERVVVRHERPRDRAARDRLHHRRLDLEEAEGVEEVAQEPHHARARAERLARGLVDDQVDVALPVARLGVREAVPLVGQRPQRLHQQAHRLRAHRQLAGARAHEHALGADDVAHVPALERLVGGAEGIRLQVQLDLAARVLELRERRLAHEALEHHAARDAHAHRVRGEPLVALCRVGRVQVGRERIAPEIVRERDARLAQARELRAALGDQRVLVRGRLLVVAVHGRELTVPASGSLP